MKILISSVEQAVAAVLVPVCVGIPEPRVRAAREWRYRACELVSGFGTPPSAAPQLYFATNQQRQCWVSEPSVCDGGVWRTSSVGAPPVLLEEREPEFDSPAVESDSGGDVDVDVTDTERASNNTMVNDGFCTLVAAIQQVLLAVGATRSAAALPRLLEDGAVEVAVFAEETVGTLGSSAPMQREGTWLRLSPAASELTRAWKQLLRGETADMSLCGTTTLDRWAAEIAAWLLGQPGRADDLRRELRRRGVAAFGLLAAA